MHAAALCAYFVDSLAAHVAERLSGAGVDVHLWALEWTPPALARFTRGAGPADKFVAFNRLLPLCRGADVVLFVDDDVRLPERFVPDYLAVLEEVGADLAQPAQTENSICTFKHVLVDRTRRARRVNWVESGPLFSMSRRFLSLATPFPESAYMGWGLDHLWASILRAHGLQAALVDATPVEHAFRPQASRYDPDRALRSMRRFLRAQGLRAVVPAVTPLEAVPRPRPAQAPDSP